jgi:WD40 repeat protein
MSAHLARLALGLCLAVASLALAYGQPLAAGDAPSAKEDRPRTDSLGDPLPAGAVARLGTTRFRRPENREDCLGFSSAGKALVCASYIPTEIRYRDLHTYQITRRIRLAPETYASGLRSADGKLLLCSRAGNKILIDLSTEKEVARIPAQEIAVRPGGMGITWPQSYALSRDGRLLAALLTVAGEQEKGEQLICWCQVASGKRLHWVRSRKGGSFSSLEFTRDGKALAAIEHVSAFGKTWLRLWDVASGKELRSVPLPHNEEFNRLVAFLPDGKFLLSKASRNGPLLVCDPATGQAVRTFPANGEGMQHYTLSADGKTLFGTGPGLVRVWEVETGRSLRDLRLVPHRGFAPGIRPSLDSKILAAVGQYHLTLWGVETGKQLAPTPGHTREVSSLAFSPSGDRLLSAGIAPGAILWDVASGKEQAHLMPVVPRPSRNAVLVDSNDSNNWVGISYPGAQAVLAADGNAATVWPGHAVQVWRVGAGKILHKLGLVKAYQTLAFAAGSQLLAAADEQGEIRLWNTASGKPLDALRIHDVQSGKPGAVKAPTALALSADGKSLAAARLAFDGHYSKGDLRLVLKVRAWEVVTRAERLCLDLPARSRLGLLWGMRHGYDEASRLAFCLRFSPDGRLLALGDGNVIYLWALRTGKEVRQFAGSELAARTLAFSPDGKLLAAGRHDGQIRLWRVDTGTVLRDLPAHDRAVTALAFSPDGRLLASGGRDTTILLWDVRAVAGH